MAVDYSSSISRLSKERGDILTSMNIYTKDVSDIENEIKAARVAHKAAKDSGDSDAAAAAWSKVQNLDNEWGVAKTNLANLTTQSNEIQSNIERLQTNQAALAAADKVPVATNNPVAPETNAVTTPVTTTPPAQQEQAATNTASTTGTPSSAPSDTTDPTNLANRQSPIVTTDEFGTTVLSADASKVVSNTNGSVYTDEMGNLVEYSNPTESLGNVTTVDPTVQVRNGPDSTFTDELGTTVLTADASKVVSNTNGSVYTDELGNMVEYSNPTRSVGNVAKASAPTSTARAAAPPKEQKIEDDWRFRIQLAKTANYFYNTAQVGDVMYPLKSTAGVIFPYMPTISMAYSAIYDQTNIPHTNFKHYQYQNSEIAPISLSAEFTAQDTYEANYMLAMIHFFRSVTKMFYGKDSIPSNGTPPPLCFLSGLGQYQFDMHPVQIASFNYTLPNDVDYIRTGQTKTYNAGGAGPNTFDKKPVSYIPGITRKENNKLPNGAVKEPPKFASLSDTKSTYVPMKIQII
ncbi:hypothetical protein GHT06_001889 [Daphnia sinensis]|uniref:Uncharacterized protein n=1 Tax=Daphnia sinensis TaxID=1820382 RepID=A0AAD5KDG1_9CRUS|nr:hypothetical protein GHT06_001889 [Daphnia sinensis]